MSRARTLASILGSDGALNAGDVSGLAAVATSGSASDLSTGTLPIARVADGAVTTAKLADASITNAKYALGSVTAAIISDGAALKGMGEAPAGNNQNLNNFLTTGLYTYVAGNYTGTTNTPPGNPYGTFLVFNVGAFTTQMFFPHGSGAATGYYRTKYMTGTNNEYWMSWSAF